MASRTPKFLLIHRERLKPGAEAAYTEIEEDTARIQRRLGCPHPYLGAESLGRPKQVWFFNGYESRQEWDRILAAYAGNEPLMAALKANSIRKARLIHSPLSVLARHRADLDRRAPWTLGVGRFLVITLTKQEPKRAGTTFEAGDGTRFVITPARTRAQAAAAAARAGRQTTVLAVRPSYSSAAPTWIDRDPAFWRRAPPLMLRG